MPTSFTDLLGQHLARTHNSVNRLAKISGVPQRTLANWLDGKIRKPQQWQAVVKAAAALHLTPAESDALLQSAGHPCLSRLRQQTTSPTDLALLANLQPVNLQLSNLPPAPFQAIASPATFVGRETELTAARRVLLKDGRAAVCGLRGMGGVGKTALAAHLAAQLRGDFPDGVLWARLDTTDTLSILGTFADAYGKDVSPYRDVESRAAVVRGLLADKRALLVLDNAENSAQVRPLLPPSTGSCAVLITTRADLSATDGWPRLIIEPFDPAGQEALLLFEKYLGRPRVRQQQAALLEIATLLGHLPLALSIAAGQLAYQAGGHGVENLLAALHQSASRLDALARDDLGVRASFDVSYAALASDQQAFFAALGVFGGDDFGGEAVAFLWNTSPVEAHAKLETLVTLSLVQISQAERYRLHPLLRDYAREKLKESGQMPIVVDRMLNMFQQAAQGQWQFSRPLYTEILNVRYALDQAAKLPLPLAFLETIVALHETWISCGWLKPSLMYWDQACAFACERGDTVLEIRLMVWHAASLHALGEIQTGEHKLQAALKMAQAHQVIPEMADILCGLGKSYYDRGVYTQARPYYVQSLELARQVDYTYTIGRNLNNLGLIEHAEGHYEAAENLFAEAISHLRALDSQRGVATVMMNLSNVFGALGEAQRTTTLRKEALEISRQENNIAMIVTLLLNLADGYEFFYNDLDEAERLLLEGLDMATGTGLRRLESQLRVDYANVLRRRRQFTQAEQQIQQSLAIAQHLADVETWTNALRLQGELSLDMGQLKEATNVLKTALQNAQQYAFHGLFAEIMFLQARVALAQAQPGVAHAFAEESIRTFEKYGPPFKLEKVRHWWKNIGVIEFAHHEDHP